MPEAIIAWKPDKAPHAMVTNRKGNSEPVNTGPSLRCANSLMAGTVIVGWTTTIASASITMTPTFMKVDR